MTQRIYKYATVFNARIINMRHLWEPSTQYMGKPVEKPNYLASVIIPKTRTSWFEEPQLAGFVQAGQELYTAAMANIPFPQTIWPIKDGDIPEPGKAPVEWMRGHWYLTGSSSSPISTEIVQGGVPVKIMNRAIVKPGDFVAIGVALAVKTGDPRGVKCYLNSVLFMGSGEEIAVGNSITGAELMAQAKAQGLNVTGFGAGLPQAQGFGAPQAGFTSPNPQGGSAPTYQSATPPAGVPNGQPGFNGGFAPSPSNGAGFGQPQAGFAPPPLQPPAPQSGFGAPGGFTPPQGFPQR